MPPLLPAGLVTLLTAFRRNFRLFIIGSQKPRPS